MKLIKPLDNHLLEMMDWFSNEQELSDWAGPNVRFPFDFSSFFEDIKLDTLNSFVLVSNEYDFLAFGQYYQLLGKCHLSRLVVNPKHRGEGIVLKLMQNLCALGLNELNVKSCSLFVLPHNKNAIKAYENFGFTAAHYPEKMPLDNCLYMVKS